MTLRPGLYDRILTESFARDIRASGLQASNTPLDATDSHDALASHFANALKHALALIPEEKRPAFQVQVANEMLEWLAMRLGEEFVLEEQIAREGSVIEELRAPFSPRLPRPLLPLSATALLVNGHGEPRLGEQLRREIASADRIDLICAFIKWYGLRILEEPLRAFLAAGKQLRVITTSYLGATEMRPLLWLMEQGAQIKISYDTETTRLHAKAWLLHRDSGFSTAYVGSSNLSRPAMLDGVEWNVRLSTQATRPVLDKFSATFETYWNDPSFEAFHPERMMLALRTERTANDGIDFVLLDVHPYPHQRAILEAISVERERHGRFKNLVVAATGTGKTIIAALDYNRLRKDLPRARLLFIAHRKEILEQSLRTFRAVLKDGAFGRLFVDGHRPEEWDHVFASIQSLSRLDADRFEPSHFDVVIVDEFHHAEAPTYKALLHRLKPAVLVGLTATPERADGQDILSYFDGKIAAELRLWEALERGLLCPFHYFGSHDDVDLSHLRFSRRGYDLAELEKVYTGDDMRVAKILEQIRRRIPSPRSMRALGFCVSVKHALYMAQRFQEAGIPSIAVHAESGTEERDSALRRLRGGELNVLFAVDLFNEGVDVPEIDTLLFLRPTESATVFLQQLGRGLRRTDTKTCVTVLDFIGTQNARFRFDERFGALLGCPRSAVEKQVREGFPVLPAGCHFELDHVATSVVLENLRQSLQSSSALVSLLARLGDVPLWTFLEEARIEPATLYRNGRTFTTLRRKAGFSVSAPGAEEEVLAKSFERLLHIDDTERAPFYRDVLSHSSAPAPQQFTERQRRLLKMLCLGLWGTKRVFPTLEASLAQLWQNPALLAELRDLLLVLDKRASTITRPMPELPEIPISLHARYQRIEILTAFDLMPFEKPYAHQMGVAYSEKHRADLFFVTLRKHERDFSPTTMYRDYALSPRLFHWESQSRTTESSETGRRYIEHEGRGSRVFFFVRETKDDAFMALGPARYRKHEGERPMGIVWELFYEMTEQMRSAAMLVAA